MARLGPARLLSPEEAERQLAGPCYYLLAGFAQLSFPGASSTAPAPFVRIIRSSQMSDLRFLPRFPVSVHWKQWRDAVVPVLEDPRFAVRAPLSRRAVESGNIHEQVALVGAALRQSFISAGYGPST